MGEGKKLEILQLEIFYLVLKRGCRFTCTFLIFSLSYLVFISFRLCPWLKFLMKWKVWPKDVIKLNSRKWSAVPRGKKFAPTSSPGWNRLQLNNCWRNRISFFCAFRRIESSTVVDVFGDEKFRFLSFDFFWSCKIIRGFTNERGCRVIIII